MRDGVKETEVLSELMSGGEQNLLSEFRRKRGGLESERRARIGYQRITKLGRKVVQQEAARMSKLVKLAASTFGITKHA